MTKWRVRARNEEGLTIVELLVALTILSIGFFALASASSTGLRTVSVSRQRQVAAEMASARLEHMRNIPYEHVALDTSETLTRASDPTDPDYDLDATATRYDAQRNGVYEPLVFDQDGDVLHFEDPVTVASTQLKIYQYVTWVDDPAVTGTEDYKRLTVVVAYKRPASPGLARSVRASLLLTSGSVVIEGTTQTGQQGTAGSPSPSPSPNQGGSCAGDTQPPTGTFTLSGSGAAQGFTASRSVTVSLAPEDACTPIHVSLSNDDVTYGATITYDPLNPTVTWTLTTGDGSKSVWARFTDGTGNQATFGPRSITLDTTPPSAPGTLTRGLNCTGNDRTVSFTWGAATDANLLGYRMYRSIDNNAYAALLTTAALNASDTHLKTLDSVRFKLVAYDKAGNEGPSSNAISLSKNEC